MADSTPARKATSPAARRNDDDTTTNLTPSTDRVVGREHTTGDDPERSKPVGFHDSLSGRPVNEAGVFQDTATPGSEEAVPAHRIVADNWPELQDAQDEAAAKGEEKASDA